ncbi:MAG: hypothetical protein A3F40_02055 [Chlamydiae bacterium RIFCSPHIGHO2_12_FULL_27_8]|nr:MAG: hypothetical protein A3F40_02055 [Chlamydiae bacterium RIFCSPHIGHO2_12_FULL_27_8]OGN64827.1 MAG: hypothetical protein A2888_00875 [Chlamydiae bacterium RIFCSPLOWO2_01_FULL_28_7]
MLNFSKSSKLFINFLVFLNILTISLYTQNYPYFDINLGNDVKEDLFNKLFDENRVLSFDAVIDLLEEIEDNEIENKYSQEDIINIIHFIAYLAKHGQNPNATEKEKNELEKDINELLGIENSDAIELKFHNSSYNEAGYSIIPAIYYNDAKIIECKSAFSKMTNSIGKFAKKHKKALIITGIVVVVAAVAVVATVAVASSTAAAGLAASSKTLTSKEKPIENQLSEKELGSIYESELQICKEKVFENNYLNNNNNLSDSYLNLENSKIVGSSIAYNSILEQKCFENDKYINDAFTPNYYPLPYDTNRGLNENIFNFQGNLALKEECYDEAINKFDKVIELNPSKTTAYLDRGYANLQLGEYEKSINDFNTYKNLSNENSFSKAVSNGADIFTGFSLGLTEGFVESGKQFVNFGKEILFHPIDTSYGVFQSFNHLSSLAATGEWKEICNSLAPEAVDLVNNWQFLSIQEKSKQCGYIFGKYGGDILIPGAAGKLAIKSIKNAEKIAEILKNLEKSEEIFVLEALTETGTKIEYVKPNVLNINSSEIISNSAKLIKDFSVEKLAEAGKVLDRGGLTKAGRALSKHGGREGSVFPKSHGNPTQINIQGQKILEEILNHPKKIIYQDGNIGYEIFIPDGKGAYFKSDGSLRGFIEWNKK